MNLDELDRYLLSSLDEYEEDMVGAYNIRKNGQSIKRHVTENIEIESKKDKDGINIYVKENTDFDIVHIPVLLTNNDFTDKVYNDFYIGKNANVVVVAGCGVQNEGHKHSVHDGIHTFHLEEGSKVRYIEKHYGRGEGNKNLNPSTNIIMKKNSTLEMETYQIKGVDNAIRQTNAQLEENAKLTITEKIHTEKEESSKSSFDIILNGINSKVQVESKAVASESSKQVLESKITGNSDCYGKVQCDAIIMDNARVISTPSIVANNVNANLNHEATIGRIAPSELIKLKTLGLSEKEAQEVILEGFLK